MIRKMIAGDFDEVLAMMKVFYDSPAVFYKASEEVLKKDISDCISDMPFVDGYVFDEEGSVAGYAMVAKGYSTEFGGLCIWIEDIYIKPEYQGRGIGKAFFEHIHREYENSAVRFRLEVEEENVRAVKVYEKCGYKRVPYVEMSREEKGV